MIGTTGPRRHARRTSSSSARRSTDERQRPLERVVLEHRPRLAAGAELLREERSSAGAPASEQVPVVRRRDAQLLDDREVIPGRTANLASCPISASQRAARTPRAWIDSRIPIASRFVTIDEPPNDMNGSGMPVIGAIPIVMPTLTKIWKRNTKTIPPATIAPNRSRATAITAARARRRAGRAAAGSRRRGTRAARRTRRRRSRCDARAGS